MKTATKTALSKKWLSVWSMGLVMGLSACATPGGTYTTTPIGTTDQTNAFIGAITGAAIGAVTGRSVSGKADKTKGTIIGAITGAAAGGVAGYNANDIYAKLFGLTKMQPGTQVQKVDEKTVKVIVPNDVTFDVNRATIKPSVEPTLVQFARDINELPGSTVSIVGYTDSSGSDAHNQVLSQSRAASAAQFIIAQGVNPARIRTSGMGEANPVASNDTAEGKARNRRVEFFVSAPEVTAQPTVNPYGVPQNGAPVHTPSTM